MASPTKSAPTVKRNESTSVLFEVRQEEDGGFVAECLTEGIFTQADNWEGLRRNTKEAVAAYFFDYPQKPTEIRLYLRRDEVLATS